MNEIKNPGWYRSYIEFIDIPTCLVMRELIQKTINIKSI